MRRLILICLLTAACVLGQRTFYGGSIYQPIAAPTTPTLTPIVGGAAGSYTYVIVYRGEDGCVSATATASTAAGPTSLDATHTIQVNGTPATGPTTMDVYRSVGGTSQGRPFGAIGIPIIIGQPLNYVDQGLQADTNIAPATSTCIGKYATGAVLSMSGTANLGSNTTINGVTAQSITAVTYSGTLSSATYVSGGTFTGGGTGTCSLGTFNGGLTGVTATIAVSSNVPGAITVSSGGSGATASVTSAVVTTGSVTCSGTITISSTLSATPAFNMGLGDPKIILIGNVASSTNSGLVAGRKYHVILCENATGGWTFAAPSTWKGLPSLVTTASVCNYWLLESNDGTNLQWIAGTAY